MDYALFRDLYGNREKKQVHIERLKRSMEQNYLLSPILVNEKYEIIDGQHRFEAAKYLGFPVYYIVVPGYSNSEVQILNTNSSNWNRPDFLNAYCELKKPAYLTFRNFLREFPELGFQIPHMLLTGLKGRGKEHKKIRTKEFEEGNLEIVDLEKARELARKLMDIKPYYKGFARREFASAMFDIFKNKNYKHKEFLHKLEKFPNKMHDCTKVEEYKILIENTYNYKRIEKVNLRY